MYASQRRKTNSISQIMDPNGNLITNQAQIGDVFIEFFYALFTSSNPSAIESCLCGMNTKVTVDMNSKLLMNFSELEVKEVVFQMITFSSPGLDGFPAHFYQTNWNTIGKDFCKFALQGLNQSAMLLLSPLYLRQRSQRMLFIDL